MHSPIPLSGTRFKKAITKAVGVRCSVGRPTMYKPEFCGMIESFFDIPLEREVVVDVPNGVGRVAKERRIVANPFPTFGRFAASIGVSSDTLRKWAKAKKPDGTPVRPEFFWSYTRARDLQESLLIEGGISGVYDYRFAVFTAKNILGWRDQPKQDVEASLNPNATEELNQIYARCRRRDETRQNA